MWTEIGIHNRTGYNPMGADSLPKIIEGVQQHHPQHSREVILKYYEYLKINFSQEFSDHGLGMVSRICDLIHKVQRQHSYLTWTEIGIQDRTGYNPVGADSLPKIIEGVQQHHPQHSREVILKYYEYLKINFSQEFSDHGLGMVSRICDLIHKVQRQAQPSKKLDPKIPPNSILCWQGSASWFLATIVSMALVSASPLCPGDQDC
ncbi:uncharacterized protein LOC121269647 isoform X2 [Carcharodon carcharias]|nr:uncharacterized protein LOC121269647 isoform X2 [Carcharodon carcharias]